MRKQKCLFFQIIYTVLLSSDSGCAYADRSDRHCCARGCCCLAVSGALGGIQAVGLHLRHARAAVLVLCLMEGRAMGHLRCERAVCAGLDEGAVDPLDSACFRQRIGSNVGLHPWHPTRFHRFAQDRNTCTVTSYKGS